MGLNGIWSDEGEYLKRKSKGFSARSTGCDCCSCTLDTEHEVRDEAVNSLVSILRAVRFFRWDFVLLVTEAKKVMRKEDRGKS